MISLYLSYLAVAAAPIVFAVATIRFTDPEPGRHASAETRSWPPVVRGQHTDRRVIEPEIVVRVGTQPEVT